MTAPSDPRLPTRFPGDPALPPSATLSVADYLAAYTRKLTAGLAAVDRSALDRALETIRTCAERDGRIYVAGNGGSAAIGNHLCCDWSKGVDVRGFATPSVHSLVANPAVMTAIANDFSFTEVFERQLRWHLRPGDAVILISSSGQSPNIVAAVEFAKTVPATVIGLTGFKGGRLRELADISLHVPVENYGIVEDAHQAIMHAIAQTWQLRRLASGLDSQP